MAGNRLRQAQERKTAGKRPANRGNQRRDRQGDAINTGNLLRQAQERKTAGKRPANRGNQRRDRQKCD
jgi:outer membrane murein-binding lipoprotein Lpp